jgi:hypothetical protein
VKRERMLQVGLGLVGLVYVALIYPLYTDLAHSKWLLEMKDACEPMFLSWFIALGPFLLLAARKPSLHRSLIAFAACQSLAHASVMAIQTVEAWKHGVHRCSASSGEFCWHSHWKDESRAHSLPNNSRNISIPLKTGAFRRSLMDGRQPLPNRVTLE